MPLLVLDDKKGDNLKHSISSSTIPWFGVKMITEEVQWTKFGISKTFIFHGLKSKNSGGSSMDNVLNFKNSSVIIGMLIDSGKRVVIFSIVKSKFIKL